MTQVIFRFHTPDGEPQVAATYRVALTRAGMNPLEKCLVVPQVMQVTTDEQGEFIIELESSSTHYRLTYVDPDAIEGEQSCTGFKTISFYVPESDTPVYAQEIAMLPPPSQGKWDEEAMQKLTQAMITAENAAIAAAESELLARAWADNEENSPVMPGRYSALHWAMKAKEKAENIEEPAWGMMGGSIQDQEDLWNVLETKVVREAGKGLSSNDFTDAQVAYLASIPDSLAAKVDSVPGMGLSDENFTALYKQALDSLQADLESKVDKVAGKQLSTNDFTDSYRAQVDALDEAIDLKVDKVPGKGLSTRDFTQELYDKLSSIEGSKFQGLFTSLAALQAAVPVGSAGFYAHIDTGTGGADTMVAIWDVDDSQWFIMEGGSGQMSPSQVKSALLANPDTHVLTDSEYALIPTISDKVDKVAGKVLSSNDLTNALLAKLNAIADEATKNSADAVLLNRANHTGTQVASTISDFQMSVLSAAIAGLPVSTAGSVVNADSLLTAISKLQTQINNISPASLVDIRSLGCVANNTSAATANTSAIQAALDAGKPLYIPDGLTFFVDYLTAPSVFHLEGRGNLAWVPQNRESPGNMLTSTGDITRGVINGVNFIGNRTSQTTLSTTGQDMAAVSFRTGSVQNLIIANASFTNFGDGVHAGGAVFLGSLYGASKVLSDIFVVGCEFRDISNVPGVYINGDAAHHSKLERVFVLENRFFQDVAADQNQIYILGPSTSNPGTGVFVQKNWYEMGALIDCCCEINHIRAFTYSDNVHILKTNGMATGFLVRDNCSDGTVRGNKFFNLGTTVGAAAISLARLSAGNQEYISIYDNRFIGWGAGNSGVVINLAAGSQHVKIFHNTFRDGVSSGRIGTAINCLGFAQEILENEFENVNYPLVITSTTNRMFFQRNKMTNCGDGAVGVLVVSAAGLALTGLNIANNFLYSVQAGTPNFVSIVSTSAVNNRIENNEIPAGVVLCNNSYLQWFVRVTSPATGAILAGTVYRMTQGALGIANGDGYIIGPNLDATFDGYGANTVVIGDTILVAPPADLKGCTYSAYVSATNKVRIRVQNHTGATVDIDAGNWTITVIKTSNM